MQDYIRIVYVPYMRPRCSWAYVSYMVRIRRTYGFGTVRVTEKIGLNKNCVTIEISDGEKLDGRIQPFGH